MCYTAVYNIAVFELNQKTGILGRAIMHGLEFIATAICAVLATSHALSTSFPSSTMGLLLSLPLAGGLGTIASSCLAGIAFCFTSTAGEFH